MSTSWYGRRFRQVYGVDANAEWFRRVKDAVSGLANVQVALETDPARYITAIDRTAHEQFDMIIVDGEHRLDCLRHALSKLRAGGVLVVDNTDVDPELVEEMRPRTTRESYVFPGYGPGAFHPWETRIWLI
jgi:predicted O-methyltransferase YrrM